MSSRRGKKSGSGTRKSKQKTPEIHATTFVALSSLKGADYNPRKMPAAELEKLKSSLEAFGFVEPVVARAEDGLVIGGHQRLAAFRALLEERGIADPGAELVPVISIENLDNDRAKILNLALNRIHGEWDFDKLAVVFEELGTWKDDIHGLAGFDEREVADIVLLTETRFDQKKAEGVEYDESIVGSIAHIECPQCGCLIPR